MEPVQQPLVPVAFGSTTQALGGAFPLLRGLKFFAAIGDADLESVAALMREVTFAPGEFIFRQGTPADGLYVIAEGRVQLWVKVADTRRDLPVLGPGHVVSEASIAETHGRHNNAEAIEPTRCWVLDIATFETLKARGHPAANAVLISAAHNLSLTMRSAFRFFGDFAEHAASPDAPRPFDGPPSLRAWGPAEYPLLRVLPAFKPWSDSQLAELSRTTQLADLPRGYKLLGEAQPSRGIFMVVRGALEVTTTRPSGRFRHGIRGPGLIVGHEAVSDGGPQMFDVSAKEASTVLALPAPTLEQLSAQSSTVASQLLSHLCACMGLEFNADCKHFVKVLAERDAQIPPRSMDDLRGSPLKD
jgi:CRP-like cAMP-binding protein